ncbi:hypothetical protein PFISCL1PPCAC_9482 [Pristionchus fissidentatus]|uniref:acid phosphatase n=1 Tax=Pristionchus fissidentatus TaxID=1538716 RepID=A0AAV5VES9_9BILA|nr:hypothetical protein PFISCL1PPCAC_9482 [Pristionchus fissidentatus]
MRSLPILLLIGVAAAKLGHHHSNHPTEDKLLSVQVVIRHADRAATQGWATDKSEKILFRGNGELTDDGIDNAFNQGRDFKKRYVDTGFIDKRYLPSEVRIRSSSVSRVLMSAASFTNALFKRTPNNHAIVPPIYTTEESQDTLLVPLLTCNDGWEDVVSKYGLTTSENAKDTALIKMLGSQWDAPECSKVPPGLVDAIIAELNQKEIKMPENYKACAKGHAKQFMFRYIEMLAGAGDHFNELRIKRVAGMLTSELVKNMQKAASCPPPCSTEPKLRVFYTHDVTVLAVAHIFKALHHFEGVTPAFSSAIVFETRMNATGPYVKVYLKNGHKPEFFDTGLCHGNCTLPAVAALAAPLSLTEPIPCPIL